MSVNALPPRAPTVVLVHGLIVSGRYMVPTALRLAAFARVHVPDLPGYGYSVKPHRALGVPALADALAAYLAACDLTDVVLLGNSFGGQIVADCALRHPARVARLVLAGPTTDPQQRTALLQIGRWLLNLPGEPLSLYPIVTRDVRDMGPARALATFRAMLRDRIEQKLRYLRIPTLVVRGGRDTSVPQRWGEQATRLLPRGRLVVLPGAAHTIVYNAPAALTRAVEAFLLATGTPGA